MVKLIHVASILTIYDNLNTCVKHKVNKNDGRVLIIEATIDEQYWKGTVINSQKPKNSYWNYKIEPPRKGFFFRSLKMEFVCIARHESSQFFFSDNLAKTESNNQILKTIKTLQ